MMYIYNKRSAFRRIAHELGVSVCYPYTNEYKERRVQLARPINIGCSRAELPEDTLNRDISCAISKQRTFACLGDVIRHPPVFSTPEEAAQWPYGWLGRRDGLSGGRGITIFQHGQLPLQAAQFDLLVGIIPGRAEYRIHVGRKPDGTFHIIATQQKMYVKNNKHLIRNYASGVRYSVQPLSMSEEGQDRAESTAIATLERCGLDFGAIDLLQSASTLNGEHRNKLYVLEVNTAPGISSLPIFNAYLEYFRMYVAT